MHNNLHSPFINYLFHNKLIGHVFTHLQMTKIISCEICYHQHWQGVGTNFFGGQFFCPLAKKMKKREKT